MHISLSTVVGCSHNRLIQQLVDLGSILYNVQPSVEQSLNNFI